ncbi:hypothetical protein PRIPAC_77620 [Pristionchus pacificus]|uniref:Uncharacterized protein n=1 Tax=Pristionchus pacificus TaxID=54126 RepID=A0A2A6C3C6_PRIPA|nr:hypothetical protein PRIPAC_77620 [Pristionchus pacificus]|eukprot:PDM72626.1 hypothetical protein PRIPAC_39060 [Pristionchus pacificus]
MTDHNCPPAPHSSLVDISQEKENEIEDINDDGNSTSNQDHSPPLSHSSTESDSRQEDNDVNAENDDGNVIANQPSYLARFSTWLFHLIPSQRDIKSFIKESPKFVISFIRDSPRNTISFFRESHREAKLFIKEGSTWGWIDQLDPIDKYPIDWEDWELPRIPYPKMVLFYETKKIKLSPEPPTVDNTKELVPIKPKSSIHDVLALLAKVDETLGVFAKPTPLEESEFREAVLRECKSRWQSALAATIVDEAVVAAAAALESVPVAVPVEDPTEMEDAAAAVVESVVSTVVDQEPTVVDDTTAAGDATELLSTAPAGATEETATDAMLEPVLATVTAQDTMAVEETIDEPTEEQSMDGPLVVDETTAAAALESAVTAVADQNSTTIGETSSHMSEMLSFIESLPVRDERRAAEDAAEVLTAPVEGPIEETAIAPMEEDAIEIAPDEEAAPVELVAAPPPMNYRRALSIVCHQYADKIYATAEGVMERELQYLKLDNCKMDGDGDGEHCEQRVHAVTCNGGLCRIRGNAGNGEN